MSIKKEGRRELWKPGEYMSEDGGGTGEVWRDEEWEKSPNGRIRWKKEGERIWEEGTRTDAEMKCWWE